MSKNLLTFNFQFGPCAERESQWFTSMPSSVKICLWSQSNWTCQIQRKTVSFPFLSQILRFLTELMWGQSVCPASILAIFWCSYLTFGWPGTVHLTKNTTDLHKRHNGTQTSQTVEQKCTYVLFPIWSLHRTWFTVIHFNFSLYKNLPWQASIPLSPA